MTPETLIHTVTNGAASPAPGRTVADGQPSFAPCHIFPSADGAFFLAVSNDYQFSELSALAGQPQWATDPRFASQKARRQHHAELVALLRQQTVAHLTEEWLAALSWVGLPCVALAPSQAGG
ncbi:CoA transferase [Pseudomonas sp.]|uniref:CoA transferase n=1 Tax=Pseudomonas sp. TaxID=306 RepID=UPI0026184590|nr:CoA transferase [Pseudomonas sp.]